MVHSVIAAIARIVCIAFAMVGGAEFALATYTPVPTDVVLYSTSGACPAGWTEYTTARGRYVVGLPSGGTLEGTAGTALSNVENRSVGQHTHVQNAHNHTQNPHSHALSGTGNDTGLVDSQADADVVDDTGTKATNAQTATNNSTVAVNQNEGSVAGTNLPYVQLIACLKL